MGKSAGGPSGKGLLAGSKCLPGSFYRTLRCLHVVSQTLAAQLVTQAEGTRAKPQTQDRRAESLRETLNRPPSKAASSLAARG